MFEELGFEHGLWVVGLPAWAFLVVEVSQHVADGSGVDGVEHLSYLHCFFYLQCGAVTLISKQPSARLPSGS